MFVNIYLVKNKKVICYFRCRRISGRITTTYV